MGKTQARSQDSPATLAGETASGISRSDAVTRADRASSTPTPGPPRREPAEDTLIGLVINGRYHVEKLLATGGMGRIYRAHQSSLSRTVALKVLCAQDESGPDTTGDPHFSQRFTREASILAKIQHPNIVTVYDYGEIEASDQTKSGALRPRHFMAMEFLEGATLHRILQDRERLPVREVVPLLIQLVQGLRAAHELGVVHRDLKPANIMVVKNGRDALVKILDFGILKIMGADERRSRDQDLTQEGMLVGSPKYMAPEQVLGLAIDQRCDLYSLGLVAYQMICGHPPFSGSTSMQTMFDHVSTTPPPLSSWTPAVECPAWLENLVMRCLAKSPGDRPASCDALEAELTRCSDGSIRLDIGLAEAPRSLRTPNVGIETLIQKEPAPGAKRRDGKRALALGIATALAAIGLGVTAIATSGHAPSAAPSSSAPPVAPAFPEQYRLSLTSAPSGAAVFEGDRLVGRTPLDVVVKNEALHDYWIKGEGFDPFRIEPRRSARDASMYIALVPAATPALKPQAAPSRRAPTGAAATPAAKPSAATNKSLRTLDEANPWEK